MSKSVDSRWVDLRQDQRRSEDAAPSRRSEEAALLPMLGEGWEAIGDGIYRFVGRRDEQTTSVEPKRPSESLADDVTAHAANTEPVGRRSRRQSKHKHLRWR